jgi:hypothetical protein
MWWCGVVWCGVVWGGVVQYGVACGVWRVACGVWRVALCGVVCCSVVCGCVPGAHVGHDDALAHGAGQARLPPVLEPLLHLPQQGGAGRRTWEGGGQR